MRFPYIALICVNIVLFYFLFFFFSFSFVQEVSLFAKSKNLFLKTVMCFSSTNGCSPV